MHYFQIKKKTQGLSLVIFQVEKNSSVISLLIVHVKILSIFQKLFQVKCFSFDNKITEPTCLSGIQARINVSLSRLRSRLPSPLCKQLFLCDSRVRLICGIGATFVLGVGSEIQCRLL
jgi:hypothetical protein